MYERLSALLEQYKMLTRFEQPAEGRAKIKQIAAVYGSVTDLEDKITALRNQKYYLDNALRYNHLSENGDFAKLSQARETGSWMYKMVNDPATAGKFDFGASVGKYVGPFVGTASMVYDALNFDNIQHMNDDERATFNYIYAKEGEKAAKEYLEYLEYTLNERSMNKALEWVSQKTEDAPGLASLLSTPLALMGGHGWVDVAGQNLRNKVTGNYKPIDYNRDATFFNRSSDMIRDTTERNIRDEGLRNVYQLGIGVMDSAAVDALKMIHPALGLGLAGSSAATKAMLDAKQKGATDKQALAMGIFANCFEMLVDKYGVGRLLEDGKNSLKGEGELLEKATKKISGEWFDEKTTNLANSVAAYMIMAGNSNYKQNIRYYLEEHPNWNYEQAEKRALLDAALMIAETDIDQWSGLVFPPQTQK